MSQYDRPGRIKSVDEAPACPTDALALEALVPGAPTTDPNRCHRYCPVFGVANERDPCFRSRVGPPVGDSRGAATVPSTPSAHARPPQPSETTANPPAETEVHGIATQAVPVAAWGRTRRPMRPPGVCRGLRNRESPVNPRVCERPLKRGLSPLSREVRGLTTSTSAASRGIYNAGCTGYPNPTYPYPATGAVADEQQTECIPDSGRGSRHSRGLLVNKSQPCTISDLNLFANDPHVYG